MKIIFNLILAFFLSLTTPLASAKAEFEADINKGYNYYSYIIDYENSYYNLAIVEGIVDEEIVYGVFFFNDVSRSYYITLVNEDTRVRQMLPETSRGDVYVLGFKINSGSNYTFLIRDKYGHEQNLPFKLSFGTKTKEEIKTVSTIGLGKGVETPKLETVYWFKILKVNWPALIVSLLIAVAIVSLMVIVYFYRKKKGVFKKKDKSEFDFEQFIHSDSYDKFIPKEIEKPIIEVEPIEITVEEVSLDGTPIAIVEEPTAQVYKRYERDVEDEYSEFNITEYLEKEGFSTNYAQLNEEEKNQITLKLMYLKDKNLITVDDYLKEISKLWKN